MHALILKLRRQEVQTEIPQWVVLLPLRFPVVVHSARALPLVLAVACRRGILRRRLQSRREPASLRLVIDSSRIWVVDIPIPWELYHLLQNEAV